MNKRYMQKRAGGRKPTIEIGSFTLKYRVIEDKGKQLFVFAFFGDKHLELDIDREAYATNAAARLEDTGLDVPRIRWENEPQRVIRRPDSGWVRSRLEPIPDDSKMESHTAPSYDSVSVPGHIADRI